MNKKGFTLIELLIVVAIIGIIAAIAIPNLLMALQKGKQKATMADMRSVGTAIETYIIDWSQVPDVATYAGLNDTFFVPFFIRIVALNDGWGNPYLYFHTATTDLYSITSGGKGVASAVLTVPNPALYEVTKMGDFSYDLCFSNGQFSVGPKVKR